MKSGSSAFIGSGGQTVLASSIKSFNQKSRPTFMLTSAEVDRIVEMAWEDRTPFDAIDFQFNLKEKEVIELIRSKLKTSSFKIWEKELQEENQSMGSLIKKQGSSQ